MRGFAKWTMFFDDPYSDTDGTDKRFMGELEYMSGMDLSSERNSAYRLYCVSSIELIRRPSCNSKYYIGAKLGATRIQDRGV